MGFPASAQNLLPLRVVKAGQQAENQTARSIDQRLLAILSA